MTLDVLRTRGGSEQDLIAAVRRGDDHAFAELYSLYRQRIHLFVLRRVGDHGRAEDVTQEIFISALRRMRATTAPIAFKPWIYEIAKNACIDHARASRRGSEVPLESGPETSAPSERRLPLSLVGAPDQAVQAKQQLADLCGAFSGLSDSHHRILVMRELEGRSYTEIADRLEMSLPMVESTLFRARRKLGQEYDQIASGARCSQVCAVIDGVQSASSAAGRRKALGTRDSRTLLRHVAHCQACRRHAFVTGFDLSQLRTGDLARRIAALLPFPFVKRLFEGGSGALRGHSVRATAVEDLVRTAGSSGPAVLEASRTAAALIAVALTGAGAGLVVHDSGGLQAATARTIAQAPPSGGLGAFGLGLPLQAVSRQFVTAIKIAPPVVAGSVITNPFIPSLYSGQLGTIPLGPWQARGPAATPGESSLQVPTTPADATAGADGKSSAGPAGASANAGSGQPADANGTPNTGKNAQSTQQSSGSATSSGKDTGATRGSGSPTGANAMGGGSSSSQPKSTGHTSRTPAPKVTKPGDARQARTSTTGGAGSGAAQQTGGSDGTDQPAPGGPGAGPQGNAVGQTDPGASSPSPGNNNAESPPAQSANDGADNGTSTDSSRPSLSTTAADLRAVSSTIDTISLGAASTAGPDTAHGAAKSS